MRGSKREKRRGVWELRVFLGRDPLTGKVMHRSLTFHGSEREADTELAKLVANAKENRLGDRRDTVGGALDRYIAHRRVIARSPTTLDGYKSLRKRIGKAPLDSVPLPRLTAAHLNRFYQELLEEEDNDSRRNGAKRKPATVLRYHNLIHAALGFAEKEGRINWGGLTPADRADPPEADEQESYNPSVEEVRRLIESAERSRQPAMADFYRVSAITQVRRGEVCGLRWPDINWTTSVVTVRRSYYQVAGDRGAKATKSRRIKKLRVGEAGLYLFAKLREKAEKEAAEAGVTLSSDGYVFSRTEDGLTPWSPDSVTQFTTRLRDRLDLPEFHLHTLRHWTGSELLAAGVDVRTVAERQGHGDGGVLLLKRYAHPNEEQDRKASEVLSTLLGLPMPGEASPRGKDKAE